MFLSCGMMSCPVLLRQREVLYSMIHILVTPILTRLQFPRYREGKKLTIRTNEKSPAIGASQRHATVCVHVTLWTIRKTDQDKRFISSLYIPTKTYNHIVLRTTVLFHAPRALPSLFPSFLVFVLVAHRLVEGSTIAARLSRELGDDAIWWNRLFDSTIFTNGKSGWTIRFDRVLPHRKTFDWQRRRWVARCYICRRGSWL